MADIAELGLMGAQPLIDKYDRVWDPVKGRAQGMRPGRRNRREDRGRDQRGGELSPQERGWVLKKKSEVHSDEEIMGKGPERQQMVPYKPAMCRRTSSLDGSNWQDRRGRWDDQRVGAYRGRHDGSDSESSPPPRSRVSQLRSKRSSSKSTSASEDLGSSSEDERRCKSINRSKWLTGGFATVATIHAAAKVYSSLEERDKRHKAVIKGEISQEEARKQRHKARFQDAAAIGIAALGIKGAVGDWHEVEEKQEEHKKTLRERQERHDRRLEKQKRLRGTTRYNRDTDDYPRDRPRAIKEHGESDRLRAIKEYGESDRYRSKSMSNYSDDGLDSRALVRSKSRRRSDE